MLREVRGKGVNEVSVLLDSAIFQQKKIKLSERIKPQQGALL